MFQTNLIIYIINSSFNVQFDGGVSRFVLECCCRAIANGLRYAITKIKIYKRKFAAAVFAVASNYRGAAGGVFAPIMLIKNTLSGSYKQDH